MEEPVLESVAEKVSNSETKGPLQKRVIPSVDYETEYVSRLDNALRDIEEISKKLEQLEAERSREKLAKLESIQIAAIEGKSVALQTQLDKVKGTVKKIVFRIKEGSTNKEFAETLLAVGGLTRLQTVIRSQTGNIRAYALSAVQNLLEHDLTPELFSGSFINLLMHIIVTETLVNLCRPATGVLIKLIMSARMLRGEPVGIDTIFTSLQNNPKSLSILVQRLSATDYFLQTNSLHLINHLYRAAGEQKQDHFIQQLTALKIRKTILQLMLTAPSEELSRELVEFQRLYVIQSHREKRSVVVGSQSEAMLKEIWDCSGMEERDNYKWRLLGFTSESPRREIQQSSGKYGLQTMHQYVTRRSDDFRKFLVEQSVRLQAKQCPFARSFLEVTQILCDYWEIASGYPTRTVLQPFLMAFEEVQAITLKTFVRLWTEMEATVNGDDMWRVSALVRILVNTHLNKTEGNIVIGTPAMPQSLGSTGVHSGTQGNSGVGFVNGVSLGNAPYLHQANGGPVRTVYPDMEKLLVALEYEMMATPYTLLREKQLKELEEGNEITNKLPIMALRDQLYQRSYVFVREQRVRCLVEGAWFPVPIIKDSKAKYGSSNFKKEYRYYRLSPNERHLHWDTFSEMTYRPPHSSSGGQSARRAENPPLEALKQRMDISAISDIAIGHSSPLFGKKVLNVERPQWAFSLLPQESFSENVGSGDSGNYGTLADFICDSQSKFSEWIDGFNMLLDRNIATRDTGELVRQFHDIHLKVALLDLTAGRIEVPDQIPEPCELPGDLNFFYKEQELPSWTLSCQELASQEHSEKNVSRFVSSVAPTLDTGEVELSCYNEWCAGDSLLQGALKCLTSRKEVAQCIVRTGDASSAVTGSNSHGSAGSSALSHGTSVSTSLNQVFGVSAAQGSIFGPPSTLGIGSNGQNVGCSSGLHGSNFTAANAGSSGYGPQSLASSTFSCSGSFLASNHASTLGFAQTLSSNVSPASFAEDLISDPQLREYKFSKLLALKKQPAESSLYFKAQPLAEASMTPAALALVHED